MDATISVLVAGSAPPLFLLNHLPTTFSMTTVTTITAVIVIVVIVVIVAIVSMLTVNGHSIPSQLSATLITPSPIPILRTTTVIT
jgi:hypothetical protein